MVGLEAIGTHEALAHFAHLVFGLRFFIHFGTRRHKRNSNSVSQFRTGRGRNGASRGVIKTVPANFEFAGYCRAVNYGVVERYGTLLQKRIARLAEQPCTHVKGRDFAFKFKLLTNGGRIGPGPEKSRIRRPPILMAPISAPRSSSYRQPGRIRRPARQALRLWPRLFSSAPA